MGCRCGPGTSKLSDVEKEFCGLRIRFRDVDAAFQQFKVWQLVAECLQFIAASWSMPACRRLLSSQ